MLHQLSKLKNPFAGIFLLSELPGPPLGEKPWIWELFEDSANWRGLGPALARLPPAKRTRFRKHIKSYCPPWWNPDDVWTNWPTSLDLLNLTPPPHPNADIST
jgi:hypothetical protein